MESTQEVVSFPCQGKHIHHRDSLLRLCQAEYPKRVLCPLCRGRLFNQKRDISYLKFRTPSNKAYENDERFNRWESFERSCADIDAQKADNNTCTITYDKDMFCKVLDFMIAQALEEPASSTPYHLQPARCTDVEILKLIPRRESLYPYGFRFEVRGLYNRLRDEVYNKFIHRYLKSFPQSGFAETRLQRIGTDRAFAEIEIMRPGFYAFVERTLSRTLQLMCLRSCECVRIGLHAHGGRITSTRCARERQWRTEYSLLHKCSVCPPSF